VPSLDTAPELGVRTPSIEGAPRTAAAPRLASIDLVRGMVMIFMALDHARFFFLSANAGAEYIPNSTPAFFFTRWITHFCAPAFFFLAGASACLFTRTGPGRTVQQLTHFLWTRGLWLMLLEFTAVDYANNGLLFSGYGGVIWCLGLSMTLMALLVRLPMPAIGAFSFVVIVGHHLLDPIGARRFGNFAVLWSMLHSPGIYPIGPVGTQREFFALFTLLPWVGVMAFGYVFGPIFLRYDRRKMLFWSGALLTLAFVLLRAFNLYGNGSMSSPYHSAASGPWAAQPSVIMTIASFLNTVKYPASLQFLLMTLGPILMTLAWFENVRLDQVWARVLLIFGRVPLFFYILHLLLLRTMAIWMAWAQHQDASWLQYGGPTFILPPPNYGFGLPFVYAMWVAALIILYLPCKWFMKLKKDHSDWWWLRYL
jgi:uncharacterized membrane protein